MTAHLLEGCGTERCRYLRVRASPSSFSFGTRCVRRGRPNQFTGHASDSGRLDALVLDIVLDALSVVCRVTFDVADPVRTGMAKMSDDLV